MKKLITLAAIICLLAAPAFPSFAYDWEKYGPGSYTAKGIDVSHYQGDIDWDTVKDEGVEFVMIRTRFNDEVDPKFDEYAREAAARDIKIGAYIYSVATNPFEAEQDAAFILNVIKDYPISYPVAIDIESLNFQGEMEPYEFSEVIDAFCGRIKEAGYYPMVYSSDDWINNRFETDELSRWPVWAARYGAKPKYKKYEIWQATAAAYMKGISDNLIDLNFAYKDYSSLIPANSWKYLDGQWWYYRNYKAVRNDWVNDGSGWYYMDMDGRAVTGIKSLGGMLYSFDSEGKLQTSGQIEYEHRLYDINADGHMSEYVPPETAAETTASGEVIIEPAA